MQGKHARNANSENNIEEQALEAAETAVVGSPAATDNQETAVLAPSDSQETAVLAPSDAAAGDAATVALPDQPAAATVALPDQPAAATVALPSQPAPAGVSQTAVMPSAPSAPAHANQAPAVPPVAPPGVPASQTVTEAAAGLPVIDADTSAYTGVEMHKKRRAGKAVLITLCIIIGFLAVAYGVGVYIFSQRFLPGTSFGSVNVSMMEAPEIQAIIEDQVDNYQLDVVGGAFSYRATADELGLSVDAEKMAKEMVDSQNAWAWPVLIVQGKHEVDSQYTLTYDEKALDAAVKAKVEAYNEGATPSQNATIVYNEATDAFVVQPDVTGTQYQPQAVVDTANHAVASLTPFVTLTDDQLIKADIRSDDEKLVTASQEASKMVSGHLKLKLDGEDAGEIGPDDLHDLIRFDDDLSVYLDEDELSVWVDGIVKRYDTVGSERHYTRPDGKEITVSGGEYGWEVDQDALRDAVYECVNSGSDMEMDIPCWQTAQVFNGQGEPDWGNRYVDVDLSEQYVRFYDENGDIIWESACITGVPDGEHDTVEGVWSVNNKESPSKLIGRDRNGNKEYETTVQYWMAFEQNSIGFHDATWQPAFGGEMYRQGYGSHGCVNLPYSAAEELYSIIDWDDVVIVHW